MNEEIQLALEEIRNFSHAILKIVPKMRRILGSSNALISIGHLSRVITIIGCLIRKHQIPANSIACQGVKDFIIDIKQKSLTERDVTINQSMSVSMDSVRYKKKTILSCIHCNLHLFWSLFISYLARGV